jgi:hypothetical protein
MAKQPPDPPQTPEKPAPDVDRPDDRPLEPGFEPL